MILAWRRVGEKWISYDTEIEVPLLESPLWHPVSVSVWPPWSADDFQEC